MEAPGWSPPCLAAARRLFRRGSGGIDGHCRRRRVVIIGATGTVSPFRSMARPEIVQPADLKGKKAGITTFGSTSDQVLRIALKKFNLDRHTSLFLTFGAQPEAFAALESGPLQVAALSYPLYPKAVKLGMRNAVNFSDLGIEDINGTVITTRTFIAQQRDTALRSARVLPGHRPLLHRFELAL